MTTQRDELAREIFIADNSGESREAALMDWEALGLSIHAGKTYAHSIADGLIADGYTRPRTITTPYEDNGADDLPAMSVVLSGGNPAIMQHDRTFLDHDGSSWDTWEMEYPLTVLHEGVGA